MREESKSGNFFCPNCSSIRVFKNIYQYGWSLHPEFVDKFFYEVCPDCGDETYYDPRSYGFLDSRPKCPNCGKKLR